MKRIDQRRRSLLGGIGGVAGIAALSPSLLLSACENELSADSSTGVVSASEGDKDGVDVDFRLRARRDTVPILPGAPSEVWCYEAAMFHGPANTLTPVTVIGTDGGLLAKPQRLPYVTLAPAQRVDVWIDLSQAEVGHQLSLVSDPYHGGMMGGMMGRSALPAGARFDLLGLRVTDRARDGRSLPQSLDPELATPPVTAATPIRRFELGMRMMRVKSSRRGSSSVKAGPNSCRLPIRSSTSLFPAACSIISTGLAMH